MLMQTTSGFWARTASKSVVILTSHGRSEQLADGLPLFGGVGDDDADEVDVLRAVEDEPQEALAHHAGAPLSDLDHVSLLSRALAPPGRRCSHSCIRNMQRWARLYHDRCEVTAPVSMERRVASARVGSPPRAAGGMRRSRVPEATLGRRSDAGGWRRLVDRVVREDGKLFAHHAPFRSTRAGGRRRLASGYAGRLRGVNRRRTAPRWRRRRRRRGRDRRTGRRRTPRVAPGRKSSCATTARVARRIGWRRAASPGTHAGVSRMKRTAASTASCRSRSSAAG